MWGRKKKREVRAAADVQSAKDEQRKADEILEVVASQDTEVNQIVNRLERRVHRNNFGLALEKAMEARGR